MKRSLVYVLSILALALAAPVMAQSEQSVSGTVVSSSADQLVIKTADGQQMTFRVDNTTNRPSNLAQGANVTVRYQDMNGTFHAANVAASTASDASTSAGTTTTTPSTTTAPQAGTTTGATTGSTPPSGTTTSAQEPATTTTGQTGTTGTTGAMATDQDAGRLPATASPLPLMGLSGLLALAGGLGVRAVRRRK